MSSDRPYKAIFNYDASIGAEGHLWNANFPKIMADQGRDWRKMLPDEIRREMIDLFNECVRHAWNMPNPGPVNGLQNVHMTDANIVADKATFITDDHFRWNVSDRPYPPDFNDVREEMRRRSYRKAKIYVCGPGARYDR